MGGMNWRIMFAISTVIAIALSISAVAVVHNSVVLNSEILNSSVYYSRIENSTFCGNFTVYAAVVRNNTLVSGLVIYNSSFYNGPFSISRICDQIAPSVIGKVYASPSVVNNTGSVIFSYIAPRIGYSVFISSSELSKLDDNSDGDIYLNDTGAYPDQTAYDGIYSANYTVSKLNNNTDGNKTLAVNITDNLGNNWRRLVNVTLDNTAPNASISINGGAISVTKRLVILVIGFNDSIGVDKCRYANEDLSFGEWQGCSALKDWQLSIDDGNKTVMLEVRDFAGNIARANDSIYFNVSGNIDVTEPSTPVVLDDETYSVTKDLLHATWNSTDPEAVYITYQYRISYNNFSSYINASWNNVGTLNEVEVIGLSLLEGENYTFEVIAFNSNGMPSDVGYSDGIIIDTIGPSEPIITGSNGGAWDSSSAIGFNWSSNDSVSGIAGYSYALTSNSSRLPDYVPEAESPPVVLRNSEVDGNFTVLKYNYSGSAQAIFLEVRSNLSAGDMLNVKALLSESHVDSSQLMGLNVYAVASAPSDYNEMGNNISNIANFTEDFGFAGVYGTETYTAEIGLSSNITGSFFVAVSGNLLDDDNTYNLLLSSSNTSSSGLQSYVCYEGGSCINGSNSAGFGVRVEKRKIGLDGIWRRSFTVADGTFYFIVRAKDIAGNWGNDSSYTVRVDGSGPSTPNMIIPVAYANTTTVSFNWTAANDIDSGVAGYYLEVSNASDFATTVYSAFIGNYTNASVTVPSPITYYARVKARNLAGVYGSYSSIISKSVDTLPPAITLVTPQGTTVHSDVVISVETDEQALCRYSVDLAPYSLFSFTNRTYHETILGFAEGSNSLNVKCADFLNNEDIANTDFDVNTVASADSITFPSVSGFTDTIARFNITVSSGATPLSGYRKEEFSFKLDNSGYPYSLSDRGNGIYTIAMHTPIRSGSYGLEVFIGGTSSASSISVNDLLFAVSYSEAGIVPSDLGMLAYYVADNYSFGLASDNKFAVISAAPSELNASSDIRSGKLFIFASKPAAEVAKIEGFLENEKFSELLEPSFGYGPGQLSQTLYAILRYNNIILIGNETLKTGIYNLVIENDGIDLATNKKRILIWVR